MLEPQWLNQRIGTVFVYWENRVPRTELSRKCVERTMDMIRRYREGEDPEQYRPYIEQRVQFLLQEEE